jgi:hypothetical protein
METTTSTTQKAPLLIDTLDQVDVKHYPSGSGYVLMHGYCTIHKSERSHRLLPLYDVCCQIDGDEVFIGRDLTEDKAGTLVNYANTAIHNGEEI